MAPEIIAEARYSHKSDVWAAGCVAFALLNGELPFESGSPQESFEKILKNQPIFKVQVSKFAKELVQAMLTSDPKQRPSASELLTAIKHKF